jgi:hypothetical protein
VQGQLLSNDKFPFIVPQDTDGLNVDAIDVNSRHSSYFRDHFKLKLDQSIIVNNIQKIKSETSVPLVGVHVRSMLQVSAHPFGRKGTVETRLLKLKSQIKENTPSLMCFLLPMYIHT